jgi:DNA-directed RNA polymerase specialized sigma24 family protein
LPRRSPISTEKVREYATDTEFRKVFADNMDSMYLLSFLLTADLATAEKCFVSSLENCLQGSCVFRDWARSWAQRMIVRNAVRMLAPSRNRSNAAPAPGNAGNRSLARTQQADAAIASILELEDLERFVFVISVLERYSDQDCALLLGCSRQDVRETRARALQHVAEASRLRNGAESGADSNAHVEQQTRENNVVPTSGFVFVRGFA